MTRVRWTAADHGMRTLLVFVLMAVALVAHCATDGSNAAGATPVAVVAYAGDPVPEPRPSCPDTHPLHDGVATPVSRVAAVDLAAPALPADRVETCGPTIRPVGAVSPIPPASPAGSDLCTEICVSRR